VTRVNWLKPNGHPCGKLQPLSSLETRWETVSLDLITVLPVTASPRVSIAVLVDRLPKMVHLKAISKTITAQELAVMYPDEIFRLHGMPSNIVSDRDPSFTAGF
jgi:hypothetical protein